MNDENPPSKAERRRLALEDGYKEILPDIFMGEYKIGHMCAEVKKRYSYGGIFLRGKCIVCGFILDESTRLALNLLTFRNDEYE
jgi:hypothetical protein